MGAVPSILPPGTRRPRMRSNEVSVIERTDIWSKFRDPLVIRVKGFSTEGVKDMLGTDMAKDNVAIVEVTSAGPGIQVLETFKPNFLKEGDIALINGMMVGRCITVHGHQHWGIPNDKVFAVLDSFDDKFPRPSPGHIFTKPNLAWMQYEYTGSYDLPIGFDDEGTVAAGNGTDPQRVAYEEVVAVGENVVGIGVGDLVAYVKRYASDSFIYRGRGFNALGQAKVTGVIADAADKPDDLERVRL